MGGRTFAVLLALLSMAASSASAAPARAQPTWTRTDVIRLAKRRAPELAEARREAEVTGADVLIAGVPPDPNVQWYREQTFGGTDPSQDIVSVQVPIDLSRRPRAERELARSEHADSLTDVAFAEQRTVTRAMLAFYDAVGAERHAEIDGQRVDALDTVSRILEAREEAGTASGFERRRLEIEAELARSELAGRRHDAAVARTRLHRWLTPDRAEPPALDGHLETQPPPPLEELVRDAIEAHPAATPAQRAVSAAEEARDASSTAWLPAIGLMAGYNMQRATDVQHGYVVGATVNLPVFSHRHALDERTGARRRLARARAQRLRRDIRRGVAEARTRLVAARKELERFEQATGERVHGLLESAEVSYREGRRSITVMLDAHRAASDVRARRLELRLQAKRAEVALHGAMGRW